MSFMISKEIIGRELRPYDFQVERGKIIEFCRATGETNPIYLDPNFAREHGYPDTPIPPTFQTVFQFWGYTHLWEDMRTLGIDTNRLLHLKEEYTYLKPIFPGDQIHAEGYVSDVKTGKMDLVTFKTVYSVNGEPCIEANMTIFIRPESQT